MRRRDVVKAIASLAATWPLTTRAQQPGRAYRLAILAQTDPIDILTGTRGQFWTALLEELRRLGYYEGRNLTVEWYSSAGDAERVSQLARQVAANKPDIIFSPDTRMTRVLKATTSTIPIVVIADDPVLQGLAVSLSRPGTNITGFSIGASLELIAKRLELLKEAVPAVSRIAWLISTRVWQGLTERACREAAEKAELALIPAVLASPVDASEFRRVFAAMAQDRVDSLYVAATMENLQYRRLVADLAVELRLPSVCFYRGNVEAGLLMGYTTDMIELYRGSAGYIDRIIKGANPAEMPVQQPTKYELIINLRTAKALGVTLPPTLLARAHDVIE